MQKFRKRRARRLRLNRSTTRVIAGAGTLTALLVTSGFAQVSGSWLAGSGNWTTAANWSCDPSPVKTLFEKETENSLFLKTVNWNAI